MEKSKVCFFITVFMDKYFHNVPATFLYGEIKRLTLAGEGSTEEESLGDK
jgi:hypothetical protein